MEAILTNHMHKFMLETLLRDIDINRLSSLHNRNHVAPLGNPFKWNLNLYITPTFDLTGDKCNYPSTSWFSSLSASRYKGWLVKGALDSCPDISRRHLLAVTSSGIAGWCCRLCVAVVATIDYNLVPVEALPGGTCPSVASTFWCPDCWYVI